MEVAQQSATGTTRERPRPGSRWVMFWLFWTYLVLAGFELTEALRGSSGDLRLWIATFSALTFLAGVLATAGLSARSEGVGLLVWVERLPDKLVQSARWTSVALILLALVSRYLWTAVSELYEPAFTLGVALCVLAFFCDVNRPIVAGTGRSESPVRIHEPAP